MVNKSWRQFIVTYPILQTWINSRRWMPEINFEGRTFIVVNEEKIPTTKMQFRLHSSNSESTIIEARIYKSTKKFKSQFTKESSPQANFHMQTNLIEKQMNKTIEDQIKLYNEDKNGKPEGIKVNADGSFWGPHGYDGVK